jgi:bifunctional UDP-N-acetylglucosamine pyrophosphorylase/glucosamine-1-phosphate N-acetyltransferase
VSAPTVVILAAGQGTRMRSALPKALHELCGRPLIVWPVAAALAAGADRVVVIDGPERRLDGNLPDGVETAVQAEPRGTGDAVLAAADAIDRASTVIVVAGDVPLISAELLSSLAAAHDASGAAATMVTMRLDEPAGYGRVVRDAAGEVERVVETKTNGDATPGQLAIDEVNTGVFAFAAGALIDALKQVQPDNAQGEYYLPDALPLMRAAGGRVAAHAADDPTLLLGVNDRADLAVVREEAQRRIHNHHMLAGVTILQPETTLIDIDVQIGPDALIEPCTQLRGSTTVGAGATVGPHSTVIDSLIADGAHVIQSHLDRCRVGPGAKVGPFAYLRPHAVLAESSKVGTFVEVKNSTIGRGAKVPHLSYIGDADVGEGTNLGAGSITANYDGYAKHRTTIGANVRGGVDVAYVAPVTVGDGAWTAAGSVLTDDVPPGALGVARSKQRNIDRYAERKTSAPPDADGRDKSDG